MGIEKKKELNAKQTVDKLRTITQTLQGAMVGLWTLTIDADGHKCLEPDDTMYHLLGLGADTEQRHIDRFLQERIMPGDRAKFLDYDRRLVEDGRAEVLYRWMHPQKGVVYFRCGGWLAEQTPHQRIIRGYHQDVTELERLNHREIEQMQASFENKKEELEQAQAELDLQYTMMDTLSQLYVFCYEIDLRTQIFLKRNIQGTVRRDSSASGHHEDEREWFLQHIVDVGYQLRMKSFTDLSTLEARLSGKKWIYEDYKNQMGFYVRAVFIPAVYDASGHLTHVLFVGQSIGSALVHEPAFEREQLFQVNEQLLRENEQVQTQLETVMSGIRGGYTINEDRAGYPFFYVSLAAARNQGYGTVEEFIEATGNSALSNIWPADREDFLEKYHSQIGQGDTYSAKYRVVCKDGSPKWVMDTGKRMVDADGRRVICCLLLDIDQYEKVDQMYRLERKQYREALLSDCEYAFTVDLTADLLVNGYTSHPEKTVDAVRNRQYPIPVDENLRQIWRGFRLIGADGGQADSLSSETVMQAYQKGVRNCESEYFDERRGQYLRVTILMSECEDDGHAIAIVIGRDITGQKLEQERSRKILEETNEKLRAACEEAEAANAAKTDFLAHMSHDIRTPLNGILGLLEIAGRCADDLAKVEDCRTKAVASANHLLALLNDVLDMSKLESGQLNLSEEPFDMNDVLRQTQEIMENQIAEKSITQITTNQMPLRHPKVIGSPLHVRQILTNLISNAVKYNDRGGYIAVGMEEAAVEERTIVYRFTISDSGIGMSPEFIQHIFEPFVRERNNGREQVGGTGLGMAIVKKIVDKMHGTIEVNSQIGEGSTFIVTLPFRRDISENTVSQQTPDTELDLKGVRVLLVEDNELNREIAQYLLTDEGAKVELAVNGREAIDKFVANQMFYYDVILMDMMMPVLDGCSAVRILRKINRVDARKIPIIALTANAFADDVKKCLQAGMNDHLAKPLDIKGAVRLIRKYIN